MIAIIVGDEEMRGGPIPLALEHAGFQARVADSTDPARYDVGNHGPQGCVLVLEGRALHSRAGSSTWASFLAAHPSVPAVVVVYGEADPDTRRLCAAPHRVLLENPFDAAAGVAAVRRAAAHPPRRVRSLRKSGTGLHATG